VAKSIVGQVVAALDGKLVVGGVNPDESNLGGVSGVSAVWSRGSGCVPADRCCSCTR
jgi:hypothetical protein